MVNLCLGKATPIIKKLPKNTEVVGGFFWNTGRPLNIKRIRMKCELCGRRVWSSVLVDDNEIWHIVPHHKPKYWWKKKSLKGKKGKHNEKNIFCKT